LTAWWGTFCISEVPMTSSRGWASPKYTKKEFGRFFTNKGEELSYCWRFGNPEWYGHCV
jgi:hypothetical protein